MLTLIPLLMHLACEAPPPARAQTIRILIEAANSGSPSQLRTAVNSTWVETDSARLRSNAVGQLGVEHWKSQRWILRSACVSGESTVSALATNELSEESDSLVFSFDKHDKLTGLSVITGVRLPDLVAVSRTKAARNTELRRYLLRLSKAGVFSGVVLLQRNGTTEFADSAGLEWNNGGRRIGVTSRIDIASAGKLFTATAVMQLVSRGSISLDDSLGRYLPDSTIGPALKGVRIRYVLSHLSGIRTRRDTLYTAPGSTFFYSNLDYVLLGELLEAVSGERFEDYFAEHVWRPAGMRRTSRPVLSKPVDYLTMGYVPRYLRDSLVLEPNPLLHTLPGNTAGSLYSTARDLAAFADALMSGRLIPRALVDSMRVNRSPVPGSEYGMGIMLWRAPGRIWGHAGDLPGTDVDLEILEPTETVAVVMSNMSGVNNPIRRRIAALYGIRAR